jgi:PelA/Pel-15E family pectate lyase
MRTLQLAAVIVMALATSAALAYTSANQHLTKPPEWFKSEEAKQVAENVLSWQAPEGGWPKNPVDTGATKYAGEPPRIRGTFDNGATSMEMQFLARVASATKEQRCIDAFNKGLDHVLSAQYPNGGWPQSYPPGEGYDRYITFNDGAMARLMFLLRDVSKDPIFSFVAEDKRKAAGAAWDKGVECILKCQVKVDGKLTVWCSQHDEKDFSPRPARSFEPVSLTASESIGLVHVLMAVAKPSPEIIAAVDAAYAYLDKVKINGIKVEDRPQEGTPRGFERFVVEDPSAPPMWARFYEIGTNKPIFCDRDGVIKYQLSEIGIERRTGYKWLGTWPRNFLEKEYAEWKAKHPSA